jgi:hypothetical protein
VQLHPFLKNSLEWLVRRQALREAVAERDRLGTRRRAAIDQAQLVLEVARRVAEPAETLPRGSRPAVLLELYRNAVTWALRADAEDTTAPLAKLWDDAATERLSTAAGGAEGAAKLRELLVNTPENASLDVLDSSVAPVRTFAEALVSTIHDPVQQVERLQVQRWTRLALVAAMLGSIVVAMPYLLQGPDLAAGRPFKLSSVYGGCNERGKCGTLMFHTETEPNPWITIDLGAQKTLKTIQIKNRSDCCAERAVPLVVELSSDNRKFSEVARREAQFSTWTAKLKSKKARYVRLRSLQTSPLHFEDVVVR